MHARYRWSLVRDKITDMLGGWIGKLRLAELIVKLLQFERNIYWRMGWRLKCLTGSYGPKGRKTSLVRRYCYVYGLICREVGWGYPDLRLMAAFFALIPTASRIARLVTAHSEDTCFMRRQVVRKQPKLGSEKFLALVCARLEKEQEYQSRLGSDKRSMQFIIGTHCAIKIF